MKKRCANKPLKRSLKGNAIGLNMLGIGKMPSSQTGAVHFSTVLNHSDYYFLSQVPSPKVVVQGRIFQHAFTPALVHQNNAQRIDSTLCHQTKELPKKSPSLLQPAVVLSGDGKEETSVFSVTPTSGTSHSSPTPSGGSLETVDDDDDFTSNYFANSKTRLPRKKRMKDPFGKLVPDKPTTKRRRVKQDHPTSPPKKTSADISEGIDVVCRCVRVGTMRRTPPKHVTFTAEYIQIDEQVRLWSYSLASCAWCHARSLPALFLKTTSGESQRLRLLLKMSRANGGAWYDSKGQYLGENYIILVFENMLSDMEKVELEKILREIGRANKAPEDFTVQLPFVEANRILMHSSHPTPEKQVSGPIACPPKSPPRPASSFLHKVSQAISGPSKPPTSDAFQQQFLDSICGSSTQTPSSKPLTPRWIAPAPPLISLAPPLISLAPPQISLAPPQIYFALPRISPPPARLSPPPARLSPLPARLSPLPARLSPPPASLSPPPASLSPAPIQVLDDDEIVEIESTFKGPVKRIILYPPPPARGGISVTNEDLHCLNEGEFLNDVIIDFYLKYLVSAVLKEEDANRSHMFSSFFYKRLTQTEQRKTPCSEDLPVKKRRHNRVRTWTRNVDLFQKDFIFVPINESAHWFLAVICFPGLEDLQQEPQSLQQQEPLSPDSPFPAWLEEAESGLDKCFLMDYTSPNPMSLFFSPPGSSTRGQPAPEAPDCDLTIGVRLRVCSNGGEVETLESVMKELSVSPTTTGVNGLGLIKKQQKPLLSDDCNGYEIEKDIFAFSPVQDSNQDQCNESEQQDSVDVSSQPTTCKQPCILIMDSLGGHVRSGVVKILQEYLEVEWEVRKGSLRSFSKESMRGSNPQVPQQDNYSDCGVYLLQYVESFFQNPPNDFEPPMDLKEWFPLMRVKRKRTDIRKLVLKIQHQQEDTNDS